MATDVDLNVLNESIDKSIVYVGVGTTLFVRMENPGGDIDLQSNFSKLELFFPQFYSAEQVEAMNISHKDWDASFNQSGPSLVLTYTGTDGKWSGNLDFEVKNAKTDATPTTGSCQVSFQKMPGAPTLLTSNLTLTEQPKPGNASLRDVLQVALENRGSVLVSTKSDPLQNTLFLNLKNTSTENLSTGRNPGSPSITVTFIYGVTSGALAPDGDRKSAASAWGIEGSVAITQAGNWKVSKADPSKDKHPKWTLTPSTTNIGVIGDGSHANVTFQFSNIISETAPGHTQMIVAFSGFKKSDTVDYDPEVYVLDIVKQKPPATRGLLNFYSKDQEPIVDISSATKSIDLSYRWYMMNVSRVIMVSSFAGTTIFEKAYGSKDNPPKPLAEDTAALTIPSTSVGGPVFTTLQAFDGDGGFLNSLQYTVYLRMKVFVDPRDGKSYPIKLMDDKFWMLGNLDHKEPGAPVYNNIDTNESKFGRLYNANSDSVKIPPTGWHIPTKEDWQGLFDSIGSSKEAYAELTKTGDGQFGAQLGGKSEPPNFSGLLQFGFYRCSGTNLYAGFSGTSKSVNLVGTVAPTAGISVRYVKYL